MYCTNCGKQVNDSTNFCPHCGHALLHSETVDTQDGTDLKADGSMLCHLPMTAGRPCNIKVFPDRVLFAGKFLYLRDKDFYHNRGKSDTAFIKDFLGMGYLTKRSYRQTVLFVFGGTVLEIVKAVVDKLGDWIDKANNVLQFADKSIAMPEWINVTFNIIAFLCIALGIALFFSKKKVIEISFTTKRICIPQKSISPDEFNRLRGTIKSLKEQ